jgi:hypothetical protein
MLDWTIALLFRPEVVKFSLDSEMVSVLLEAAAGGGREDGRTQTSDRAGEPSQATVSASA